MAITHIHEKIIRYSQEIETWLRNNPGRTLTNKYVARLFGMAYEKAATMTNSVNGFRKTGLYPCNRHIFTDEEFSIFDEEDQEQRIDENANAVNTNYVPLLIENQLQPTEVISSRENSNENQIEESSLVNRIHPDDPQGLASSNASSRAASVYDNPVPGTSPRVSPFVLKPVPRLPKNNSSKKTRTGSASIITGSPYKNSLEESLNKKQEKENKKEQKKLTNRKRQTMKKKIFEKKKVEEVSSSSEDDDMPELADSSGDEYDAECPYCSGNFSQDTRGEKWVKCQVCFKWTHEDCGEVASNRFLCSLCVNM